MGTLSDIEFLLNTLISERSALESGIFWLGLGYYTLLMVKVHTSSLPLRAMIDYLTGLVPLL
jgi:hypothetical protein